MDETTFLNESNDRYADQQVELCQQCNLPKTITTYVLGFRLLQEQMVNLRADLQQLVNKIDTLEHNRNVH